MSSTRTLSLFGDPSASAIAANILAAARALATHLARSRSLDRRLVATVMTTAFGASDADGAWAWRDAYDAIEAATVLHIRRLAPQVGRLEDAPAEITALLAAVSALGLTHTRRSEEQIALDQFSTPPHLAALVVLAAQVRPGDRVLEPSAGTGLLAVVAEACGGMLALNEIAPGRADLLDGLFPAADRTRHDGRHIHDLSVGAGAFDVVVSNPPFSNLADHLEASLKALADNGRLAAIVPLTALTHGTLLHRLSDVGVVVGRIALPSGAFAKHGTSVETGLLVVDRVHAGADPAPLVSADDLEAAAKTIAALPNARILYVSATGATTAENLAYAARLGLWGGPEAPFMSRADFLDAMDRGGVAAMELVARELKALGLYVARSLSFEGVEYEPLVHLLTSDDIAIWNAWADAFQLIHANLAEALKATGLNDEEGKAKSGQAASAVHSAFEGAKLRFFGHLLAGLKAPSLVASIRDDLANDRSSVVQIVSTNEAVMERRLASIPPEEWNNLSIDLTPREYVLDYLREAFPIHLMEVIEGEDGAVAMVPVMTEGRPAVSQEALARREALIEQMACLPAVPGVLDALLEAFGTDAVAEITGRSRRVVVRDGRRVVERRGASAARAETDAFMGARKRVLVFSDAGGTGRSYHSDLSAANQQRRVHYLVEPGWRADAAIQGLGRSHRTHQASAPLFRPVTTDIQGEKRFTSTIARRLDSLGALTRGERRTAGAGLFRAEDNLESPWARRALLVFYGALAFGELASMTLETFMEKTGMKLLDADGGLKPSDDLPPIHTFLNRLLALRISDQNALFEDFDRILSGILERAAASGDLDRGLEDIEAEELEVLDQEVIRTDVSTGAETALVTFSLKVRREILLSGDALAWAAEIAHQLVINEKSGRAAIAEIGLTTATDQDRLVAAVRLVRPDHRQTMPEKTFEESAWKPVASADWRPVWDAEVAGTDPWRTRELTLATGLLLPIWGRLPNRGCSVRRVRAPDGRRWLGRVLDAVQAQALKATLGLTEIGDAWTDGAKTAATLLDRSIQLSLGGGLWLRRARVMDRWRIEVVGGRTDRDALVALGCFVEIIAFTPRVFVPVDQPRVVEAVLRRHPVQAVLDGAAA
jgi:protein-L-isoaspartate O-methyltransferase